jgi:mono/diheme cytochrome c family protein
LAKLIIFNSVLADPDWSRDLEIHTPRENLYSHPSSVFHDRVMKGRKHALFYPVEVSVLRIPYQPLKTFFESDPNDPVRELLYRLARQASPFNSMEEVFKWLGLHDYPKAPQPETPNPLPLLSEKERELPMGATLRQTTQGTALTFGCAACHTSNLFGVKVLGLTNRFPRANEFFRRGEALAPYVNSFLFRDMLKATEDERLMLVQAKKNLKYVGVKKPVSIGLDTSLAQVALSLAKRKEDAYATRTVLSHRFPRKNKLETMVADSKPAVWWNLKYKNRWLSDGSIVSGNPVHTNFLWNEIGRGTDLKELEHWLVENKEVVDDLTAAVFASKPPRYEKFFGVHAIDLEKAKRGEKHFIASCQKCHGTYEKGWGLPNAEELSDEERLQNVKVTYHLKTPVKDVGTDPGRYLGMKEFAADLNRLAISKAIGAVVEPQKGYVPPPLDGIWARYPYFHNNSIPNLCALLTAGPKRPVTYYAGAALDKERDYDQDCGGYPLGAKTPAEWKKDPEYFYDSRKEGLSNRGHDEKIFLKDGQEIYTVEEKRELIEFLKTL